MASTEAMITRDDHDTRIPAPEECVLPLVLDRQARRIGDKTFVIFEDGSCWTYAEARRQAIGTATALEKLGVQRGDHVAVCLPNGPTMLRVWLGINYLGAVFAPIHTEFRGQMLEHVLRNSDSELLVVHADYAEQFAGIDLSSLRRAVICGGNTALVRLPVAIVDAACMEAGDDDPVPPTPTLQPWDVQLIHYTSGTTGPSKGVPITYLQLYVMQRDFSRYFRPDDRYLMLYPLFHVAGTDCMAMIIHSGATAVVPARFQTAAFWATVRQYGITFVDLIFSMVSFLLNEPPRSEDRDHPLRTALIVPLGKEAFDFAKRFGVSIYSGFDMTEVPPLFVTELNPSEPGTCGRLLPGYQVRLVDEHDREVTEGDVGELVVRADCPWVIATYYHKDPEATVRAWRNGWFHTGDAFRRDAAGNYFHMGRIKDVIRRRGENISARELEDVALGHPGVAECAAIAVPSAYGEDEVLLVAVSKSGTVIDAGELVDFLGPRLPRFMLPRYVRVVDELPRSVTTKVRKELLRSEGVTADTWDREAHRG